MNITKLAELFNKIENTASRNEMTEILAEALKEMGAEEVKVAMYLMLGRLAPVFVDLEFNFSQKLALRALQDYWYQGDDAKFVQNLYKEKGDLGLVVEALKSDHAGELEVGEYQLDMFGEAIEVDLATDSEVLLVHSTLVRLAELEGKGSQEAKMRVFVEIVDQLDAISGRYVARMIIGKLRLGLSDKTVLDALSFSVTGDKSLRDDLERAFGAHADLGELAALVAAVREGELEGEKLVDALQDRLAAIEITPGTPVASKLVEREKDSEKVFERLGAHLVQPKLDGMRAQIHYDKQAGVVQVFSRNMERLTDMFPDILAAVAKLGVDSIIIDSEVIGYDFENDAYLPFQETMQRRRKYDIDEMAASIPVRAMAFDILYLNGQDISQTDLQSRVTQLQEIIETSAVPEIKLLDSPTVNSAAELEEYFADKIGQGLEGVICKKLDTTYDPGTRNYDWIKLKANTRSDLVDTLDVVVIGYYIGRGARAKFGVGAFLTAVYDEESNTFKSVAKVGSGFKDDEMPQIKSALDEIEVSEQPKNVEVENILKPDVWVSPQIVIEVDADEITRSPAHTAARGLKADFETHAPTKGLSLRFPRLKVWNRDKQATQATSVSELLKIYNLRKG